MSGFFERFLPKSNNSKKNNASGGKSAGRTLGGSLPGKVIAVTLAEEGPLGVKVEKRPNSQGTSIVAHVEPGGQGDRAGLQRGDILCFAGTNGTEEIMFEQFLELARSNQRPICIEVRRIETKTAKKGNSNNDTTATTTAATTNQTSSADSYARKQAMLAAAEQRAKGKSASGTSSFGNSRGGGGGGTTKTTTASSNKSTTSTAANESSSSMSNEPLSEEARKAIEAAKRSEAAVAASLGYNPYETNRVTAGQARNVTVAMTHGSIAANDASKSSSSSNSNNNRTSQSSTNLPTVAAPNNTLVPEDDPNATTSAAAATTTTTTTYDPSSDVAAAGDVEVSEDFQHAFESMVTTVEDPEAIRNSLSIMRKLVTNAVAPNKDAKFRRVRLANPKIQSAIGSAPGGIEMMLAFGFQLVEEESTTTTTTENETATPTQEMVLVFPPDAKPPAWLPIALNQMEQYEKSAV